MIPAKRRHVGKLWIKYESYRSSSSWNILITRIVMGQTDGRTMESDEKYLCRNWKARWRKNFPRAIRNRSMGHPFMLHLYKDLFITHNLILINCIMFLFLIRIQYIRPQVVTNAVSILFIMLNLIGIVLEWYWRLCNITKHRKQVHLLALL